MAIVNGGYAKVQKRIYAIGLQAADGSSACELIYESDRKTAIARAFQNWKGHMVKATHVEVEGTNMPAHHLEQYRHELFGTPYAQPVGRSYDWSAQN